jgi:hypothetical protein
MYAKFTVGLRDILRALPVGEIAHGPTRRFLTSVMRHHHSFGRFANATIHVGTNYRWFWKEFRVSFTNRPCQPPLVVACSSAVAAIPQTMLAHYFSELILLNASRSLLTVHSQKKCR